jgi:mycothiol synthase
MTATMRPPSSSDAPAVLELLLARDVADFGLPDYTLEDLRDEWDDGAIDLTRDAVVIDDPQDAQRLVAYGILRHNEVLAAVRPDAEGRGLGGALLGWAEEAERTRGRTCHRQRIPASNERARELLATAGYQRQRSYWRLVLELGAVVPVSPAPEGIALRELHPENDAVELHALDALSFAENIDYQPLSLDEFSQLHLFAHNLDPALSRIAVTGGGVIVGFLLARRWEEDRVGYVDILAVGPEHRRAGLATAMLTSAFAAFAAVGLREAQLGVASDNPRALTVYERIGMTPGFRIDAYERPADVANNAATAG